MIIYKYLDETGALATLDERAVLLKTPIDFNDPFDSMFFVNDEENKKAFELFLDKIIFQRLYDDLIKDNKHVRAKLLAAITKKDIQWIASDIKKTKRYSSNLYLHPYHARVYKYLGKSKNELKSQFKHVIVEAFNEIRSTTLVSCFGSSNKSILMWSHYANSHTGACFEYEIDDKDFKEVVYSKTLPNFRLTDALEIIFGHEFLGEQIDATKDEYQFMLEPLFVKSDSWKYEAEVRCIYSKNKTNPRIRTFEDGSSVKYLLDMPKLKKIYLGCNASSSFASFIKERAGDIPTVKMKISACEYGLEEESNE